MSEGLRSRSKRGPPPLTGAGRTRREDSSAGSSEEDGDALEAEAEAAAAEKVTLLVDAPAQSRMQSFVTRASWSLVMIFSFLFVVIYLQQSGCAVLVFVLQAAMYKELVVIQMRESSERNLPGFKFLYVYWFLVCSLMIYGATLEPHFLMHSLKHHLGFAVSKHIQRWSLYCFMLYAFGLMWFVASLKKGNYKYQFKQFAYCHTLLLVVVGQSSFLVSNMFKGLIWFLLPCSLVICNDIWAYIFGFCIGKTPLIQLSPKKTWEGFLGGWLATIFFGVLMSRVLAMSNLMICEKAGFRLQYWPECEPSPIYEFRMLRELLGPRLASAVPEFLQEMQVQPMDEHVFWMANFASVVAPFGGFFASGFKRAVKVKDFSSLVPGHGGITDRMDCQVLMGVFVFVYYQARIAKIAAGSVSPDVVLRLLMELSNHEKAEIYQRLGQGLAKEGLIP